MDLKEIEEVLKGEPAYRLKQARQAVFKDLVKNWSEVSNFPLELRERLEKECSLEIKAEISESSKDAKKILVFLDDGLKVESVLMQHKDGRNTVCVSSQVGCPLGCLFCATGKIDFKRNLTDFEIVQQVLFFERLLKEKKEKVSNVVFMGMGEPFLNYDNVLSAVRIINGKSGLNIGARHISISTSGIVEGIKRLAGEDIQVNMAVSLNASENVLRSRIMPIARNYLLEDLLDAVDFYIYKTKRRVMFEYVMIKDLNDSDQDAFLLARITRKRLCFVNLIPCNKGGGLEPSLPERIKAFRAILEKNGISVTERFRFGRDIKGACGQLVADSSR